HSALPISPVCTLSLHDALPIFPAWGVAASRPALFGCLGGRSLRRPALAAQKGDQRGRSFQALPGGVRRNPLWTGVPEAKRHVLRSEEAHVWNSSHLGISYAVFC